MTRTQRIRKLNALTVCLAAAALLAALATLTATSSTAATAGAGAAAGSGGMAIPAPGPELAPRFGQRVLKVGMSGDDVQVLNGIVRSKPFAKRVPLSPTFASPTAAAVRQFQDLADLPTNGVVNKATARKLVGSMPLAGASWYGPGLYGNGTACGQTLRASTVGVAHKTLPCGSRVMIAYRGRFLLTKVIDRGPYVKGRAWDLTKAAADALGYTGVDRVRWAVASKAG